MAKPVPKLKQDAAVTCSAGYFYQRPVGLGRYFSGVAANDNRTNTAANHGLYVALASLVIICAALVSLL